MSESGLPWTWTAAWRSLATRPGIRRGRPGTLPSAGRGRRGGLGPQRADNDRPRRCTSHRRPPGMARYRSATVARALPGRHRDERRRQARSSASRSSAPRTAPDGRCSRAARSPDILPGSDFHPLARYKESLWLVNHFNFRRLLIEIGIGLPFASLATIGRTAYPGVMDTIALAVAAAGTTTIGLISAIAAGAVPASSSQA
jgi:hypothetical protein